MSEFDGCERLSYQHSSLRAVLSSRSIPHFDFHRLERTKTIREVGVARKRPNEALDIAVLQRFAWLNKVQLVRAGVGPGVLAQLANSVGLS